METPQARTIADKAKYITAILMTVAGLLSHEAAAKDLTLPEDPRYVIRDDDLAKAVETLDLLQNSISTKKKWLYKAIQELKQEITSTEHLQDDELKLKKIGEIKLRINKLIAQIAPETFERICKQHFPRNNKMDRASLFGFMTALRDKNTDRVTFQFTPGINLNCMEGQYMRPIPLDIINEQMLPIIRLSQAYGLLTPDYTGSIRFTHPNKIFTIMMTEFKGHRGAFKKIPLNKIDVSNITFSLKRLKGTDRKLSKGPLFFTSVDIK